MNRADMNTVKALLVDPLGFIPKFDGSRHWSYTKQFGDTCINVYSDGNEVDRIVVSLERGPVTDEESFILFSSDDKLKTLLVINSFTVCMETIA